MSNLLEATAISFGYSKALEQYASEQFRDGWRFGNRCATPTETATENVELRNSQSTEDAKPVDFGIIFSPIQEAQQNPEAIAYEYDSHVDCKIMISYHRLAAQGNDNEIRKCANDIVFLLKSASMTRGLTRRHNKALQWFASLDVPGIPEAAQFALRKLYDIVQTVTQEARVEWLDGKLAICRFTHPQRELYGDVEREFELDELPSGIREGEGFELSIELDPDSKRPLYYEASRKRIIEGHADDGMTKIELPQDRDDPAALEAYFAARRPALQARIQAAADAWKKRSS